MSSQLKTFLTPEEYLLIERKACHDAFTRQTIGPLRDSLADWRGRDGHCARAGQAAGAHRGNHGTFRATRLLVGYTKIRRVIQH